MAISNFSVTGTGAKTLTLRGFNTDANIISSIIAGTSTAVTKTDAGTWILAGANTYTGTTTVSSGYLGIGGATGGTSGNPLPGALTLGGNFVGAGIFATNPAGLTISTGTVTLTQGQTISFAGTNSITINSTLAATTAGDPTLTNVMSGGTLTINGSFTNPETSTTTATPRTINIRGTGNTVWNGAINNNVLAVTHTQALNISIASDASFTISGTPTFTNATTGTTTLTQGNLILGRTTNVFGGANTQTFAFNGGTLSATSDVTIANPMTLGGNPAIFQGTNSIDLSNAAAITTAARSLVNNITSPDTLTVSGGIAATGALSIFGSGDTTISGVMSGTAGAIQMLGTGTLTLTNNNTYTGASTFSGGTTTLSGNGRLGDGTVTVNQGATLTLDNTSANPGAADRLDNRALALNGANFNFIGLTTTGSDEGTAGNTLTIGSGQTTFNITNNGGTTQMDFTTFTTNTGGFTNFTSNVALGTATNRIIFATPPTLIPVTTGILARATVNGADFATYGADGIAAFANYNNGGAYTDINSAAATDTVKVGTGFVTTDDLTANRTINGLNIDDGTARTVSSVANGTLTLTSGAVLVEGGGSVVHTLSVPRIALGAEGAFHIAPSTTLNVTGTLSGTAGLNKNLGGTLTLTGAQFYTGTTTVNDGTLNLSFGTNTLFPGQALTVNQTGVVNLNNNNQYVGSLAGGLNPGSGGTINLGTGLLAINEGASTTWAGNISGNGNFARTGGNFTLTMESANAYAGTTTLMGGVTTLRDNATLLNTSSIDINYASLLLRNNDNLQTDITNRINNAAPITLRGGLLDFQGRALNASSEVFGTLTSAQGANRITSTTGGGGSFNSASITFTSLTRSNGSTVDFSGSILGQAGNQGTINFTTAPTTVGDQLLGSWAIANTTDYAAYNNTMGVGAVGSGGFTGYDWQDIATANVAPNAGIFAAGNVTNLNATAAASTLLPAGTTNTGLLRFGGAFTNELLFTADTDTLNLTLGGILRSNNNNTTNIGTTAVRGIITSGINELVVYNNQGTTTINSSIQGATKLIKSGGGTLTLTAPNTYSLGTVINQGTVNISPTITDGTVVVIPNGGLTINGGIQNQAVAVTQSTQGSIGSTNNVTINGRATLTLTGNNTLNSFTLNNNGGEGNPTLAGTGILTVSSTTPFTATSSNAATTNTISGGSVVLTNGANTIDVGAIAVGSQVYNAIAPTLNISSILTGAGNSTSILKDGAGLLQLSAQNTFLGGVDVTEGGIVLGANSTSTVPNGLVSGPLGIGATTFATATTLFVDNNDRQVANAMTYAGNPIFNNTGTTLRTLTLNGALSFGTQTTTGLVASIPTPFLNVVLGGPITNIGTVTAIGGATGANTITKTGLGNISGINLTGVSNTATLNVAGLTNATSFSLLHDGNGTGSVENVNLGPITWEPTSGTVLSLTIGRAGAGVYFPTASNKNLAPASFTSTLLPNGLTLTNSNGYGLILSDNIAFNTVSANQGPTFNVSAANNSLLPEGLVLNGQLTSGPTGAAATVLTKSGLGTLVLGNNTTGGTANTFGGTNSIINIADGILQVGSDIALGDSTNIVRLSGNSLTKGLRVTGTFGTSRVINLNAASSGIDVAGSNVLTLNSAFTFGTATNALAKNDFGTLVLTQAQTIAGGAAADWNGVFTVNQGILRLSDGASLGTTTGNTVINNLGAAIELTGGVTLADPISANPGSNNQTFAGINGGGAIRSTSGANTISGAITLGITSADNNNRAVALTNDDTDALDVLTVTGGVVLQTGTGGTARHSWVGFGGPGTINLTTTGITHTGTLGVSQVVKFGTGTLNIQVASAMQARDLYVKQGTVSVNGVGTLGVPSVTTGQTGAGTVFTQSNSTLLLDNSGTNTDNRLSNRAINLQEGEFKIMGNSGVTTTETTTGILTLTAGLSQITLDADNSGTPQQLNLTTGAVTRSAGSTLIIRADGFGDAAAAGKATIQSTGTGYAFVGQTGDTGTTNKGILPYALGDTNLAGIGLGFVTADSTAAVNTSTNRLRLLTGAEQTADLATANANVNLTSAQTLSVVRTFNSLQLGNTSAIALNYVPLTIDSGGILATTGNTGISGFSGVSYLTSSTATREIIIHSQADLSLGVPLAGTTGGLTKSGAGILSLSPGNVSTGAITVNQGTLKLSTSDQTLLPNQALALLAGQVDLNGTTQNFNNLQSQNATLAVNDVLGMNTGGNVINTSATEATLALTTANVSFSGRIGNDTVGDSDIAVVRGQTAGAFQSWNLFSNNTYTGATLLNGGVTALIDRGRLSATSAIEVSNATFQVGASNTSVESAELLDRVNNSANIALRGAMLQFRARGSLTTSETLGNVTVGSGNSFIETANPGGAAMAQFDITLTSFGQTAGSRGTVRFFNTNPSLGNSSRIFINTPPTLSNNLIGGWAVADRDFASYTTGMGVAPLNATGFAGYSPNPINAALTTDNIRTTGGLTLTANRDINALAMVTAGAANLDLGGFTLNLRSGGLIASNSTDNTAITILNGSLTSGTLNNPSNLYLHSLGYITGNTDAVNRDVIVSASIVNNGSGAVTLVINGDDGRGTGLAGLLSGQSTNLLANNTYTGGTFVNAGRVILNNPNADGTTLFATGTGNLTITGGASTNGTTFQERSATVQFGNSSQIANTATVTINGGATLDLAGFNQTLAGVIFNNTGGNTPTLSTGVGTLTLNGNISATSQNLGAVSTISGNLNLNGANRTFNVAPVEWNSDNLNPLLATLDITAVIGGSGGAGLIKTGTGLLQLSAGNAFTGNVDLQQGGLALGNNNALSTGTLTIGNNTFLTATATRTITNAYNVSGNFALRGVFNLALNGNGALASGNHDISVDSTLNQLTLGGVLSGATANINKTGDGILVLNNGSNSYGGTTTVSDGVLRYGVANAVPTGTALSVLAGGLLDITSGGSVITVGSMAGDSATAGGVIATTATSGTVTFTSGANDTSTAFGGVMTNAAGSTLNFVKTGTGTLTLGGANTYNGSTTVVNGRLVAKAVGGNSPLGTSQALVLGGGTTSGILQLGDSAAALNHTFTSLSTAGSGTLNKIVSGNASMATLTLNLAATSTFAGNIGGVGTNEANLNLVKSGVGDLIVSGTGTSTYTGTTTVSGGKLFMDSTGAFPAMTTSLTLADGTEFSLRGTSNLANQVYGFSGTGNVVTVGTTTGATLGFGIDGGFNSQLNLLTGQMMTVNGTLTTAIYVNNAPTAASYILINAADDNAIFGSGTFNLNPVVFNGGSFTYALSQVTAGPGEQWVLTPTAQPALADVWWRGDLTGLAQGVWSATLTSGTGFPSNWDDIQASATAVDAQVPPDQFSIVHFSSDAAANLATTLGANLTIQELIFHTGNGATSIGSSNGTNTLTLGNTVDASGLTIQTGAADVSISAIVALPQHQSWNINDSARQLTLSGGLTGTSRVLTVNDTAVNPGSLAFSGSAATLTGTLNINAGTLIFDGTGSLNGGTNVVLGTAAKAATLRVGNTVAATNVIIGGLSNGSFAGSRVVGGNATLSTLTIGAASGSTTFSGALGGVGTNENAFNLVKDGAGTQILSGTTNTYTGTTTVRQGTLQLGSTAVFAPTGAMSIIANAGTTATFDFNGKSYTTVGTLNLGGGANGIAQFLDTNGTKGTITLGGDIIYSAANNPGVASITTNFISTASRTITVGDSSNATSELSLGGTYTTTTDIGLTINGAGSGAIGGNISINPAGGVTSNRDVTFNSTGTWAVNAKIETGDDILINSGVINATVGESLDATDDVVVTGNGTQGSAIVNISSTTQVHTGDTFFIRGGALVNVTATNGISTGTDELFIGDSGSVGAAAAGVLNLTSANIATGNATTGLQLGASGNNIGNITGTGTITTAGAKVLSTGSIASGITLAGAGAITKNTTGVVTFAGTRDAGVGATNLQEGELILDYTTNNTSKIGGVLTLGVADTLTSRILTLNGNASAATTQSVTSTTLSAGRVGPTTIAINNGAGQTASLALGAITRTTVGSTLAFEYLSASSGATSTSPAGTLGWATVDLGGVRRLAAINGTGNIVQAVTTTENNATNWQHGQNIINSAGYFGTTAECSIESLTFDAAATSVITIATGNRLVIKSGGILVDAGVNAFNSTITGGQLYGTVNSISGSPDGELIIHQNNTLGSLTIASAIVNSSGITKTGNGNLTLSGTNTFRPTAQINLNGLGALTLGGGNAIGDTTPIFMIAGSTLALTSSETIGNLTLPGLSTFNLAGNSLTINQTGNATISGIITSTGSGGLTKNGAGTLTVTGDAFLVGALTVNGGAVAMTGGAGGGFNDVSAFILNGAELRNFQDQTTNQNRMSDTAAITLNNTAGTNGFVLDSNQNATRTDNIGAINLGFGHNVVSATSNAAGTAQIADILADGITRGANRATVLVRGVALGSSATVAKGFIRLDSGGQTAIEALEVGGGGAANSLNISIVPWIVGDLANAGLGNTFVTHDSGATGLRPLAAAEYTTNAAAFNLLTGASTNNVRFDTGATLTGAATAINSLVIDAATGQTVTGPANTIEITSGAILAASSGTTITHVLGGFDNGVGGGITTGGGRDYTVYVTSTTGTFNISAPLTSAVPLVKSGAGVLQLTNAGNTFTNLHINQGAVLAAANNVLGTGNITFSGGILRLNTGYVDDLGAKTMIVSGTSGVNGGGTIDTNGLTVAATNLNLSGSGTLTKAGTGTLTIGGAVTNTHTGLVLVTAGTLALNATGNPIGTGGLSIISGANPTIVNVLANEQIANAAAVNVESVGGNGSRFNLNGFTETIGSLNMTGTTTNETNVSTGSGGVLIVNGNITLNNNRDATGNNGREVLITGTGTRAAAAPDSGTLNLGGAVRTITVQTNNAQLNSDATIETTVTNGGIIKEGNRVLYLTGTNTYALATTINDGTLSINSSASLGNAAVTNTIAINNNAILQSTGASVDLGTTRSVTLDGLGGRLEVTGANTLVVSGVISGDDCAELTKIGTGILALAGTNTYLATTTISAGTLQVGNGGTTGTLGAAGVVNNATLAFNRTNDLAVTNAISGTGAVTQTGTGRTILSGTNTYAGVTTVNAGTLQFANRAAFYNDTPASWTATNLVVNSGATAAFNVGGAGEFTLANIDTLTNLGTAGGGFRNGSSVGIDTTNAGGTITYNTLIDNPNAGANALGVTKLGTGELVLTGANTYTGKTNVNGGVLAVATEGNLGATPGAFVADHLGFNGGVLRNTGNMDISANRGVTLGANDGGVSNDTGTTLTVNSVITGAIGSDFTKSGAGTTILTAANTYAGTTTVTGGVFQVGTTATAGTAAIGSGAVTVGAGATLTGTGTVGGAVVVQGTGTTLAVLTPGDNAGATNARLNLGSSLSIGASGQLQFQITTATYNDAVYLGGYANASAYLAANPGQVALWNTVPTLGSSDFVNVAGSLTINTSANAGTIGTVRIIDNGYTPNYGDVFNLIDWVGAMGGTFNAGTGFTSGGGIFGDFDLPTLSGGFAWDTSAFVQYGVVVVVPEPGRALLMLLGLMALFFRRRRRD